MDNLIPLLYLLHNGNAQAAVDDGASMLRDAVTRFELAAKALLEDYADDLAKTDIAKFIDSCRYACTANRSWR